MADILPSSSPPAGTHWHGLCDEENSGKSTETLVVRPFSAPDQKWDKNEAWGTRRGVLWAHHQLRPAARSDVTQRASLELLSSMKVIMGLIQPALGRSWLDLVSHYKALEVWASSWVKSCRNDQTVDKQKAFTSGFTEQGFICTFVKAFVLKLNLVLCSFFVCWLT